MDSLKRSDGKGSDMFELFDCCLQKAFSFATKALENPPHAQKDLD